MLNQFYHTYLPEIFSRSYSILLGILRLELISQTPGIPVSSTAPIIAGRVIPPQEVDTSNLVLAIRERLIPYRGPRALLLAPAPLDPRDRVIVRCTIRHRLPHNWITLFIHDARRKCGARTRPSSILVLPVGVDVFVFAELVTLERAELVSWCRSRGGRGVLMRLLNLVAKTGTAGTFGFTRWLD